MCVNTVIITGGANGVGKALVEKCLSEGMTVIACDIDAEALEKLADENAGRLLEIEICDVGKHDDCEKMMDRVLARHPEIDGLVNNAGLYLGQSIWKYDDETIDRVISVNVKGPMWLSRRFADHIMPQKKRGAIVNLASVAGEVGSSDAVYGTVKAGVIGLTKSNAMNFAPYIRVNAVSPGLVTRTKIADRIPAYRYKEYKRQELLDGDIVPEDVAAVCSYLLGDGARTLTGATVPADNGCYPR
jgi:3-oxoacyl-[acyl-carrier protein] reductase